MKEFFKQVGATVVGIMIFCLVVGVMSVMSIVGMIASSSATKDVADNTVFVIDLNGQLQERAEDDILGVLSGGRTDVIGLDDLLLAIKKAKNNDKVKGIYIQSGLFVSDSYASLQAVRKALVDFKKSGKWIVAYGDVYTQATYYLSSVADKVYLNPSGQVEWSGICSQTMFVKDLMAKFGVKMQVVKVGAYKSATEIFTGDKMSDANKEQVSALINGIWNTVCTDVAKSRKVTVAQLNQYADNMITLGDPKDYVKYKLVDKLLYVDQLKAEVKKLMNLKDDDDVNTIGITGMAGVPGGADDGDCIAVYYAYGDIVDNATGMASRSHVIDGAKVSADLRDLADDDDVKAVVIRINSGGGSAYASEQIWRAVQLVKAKKPVVVSMGGMAASGGYYISCSANWIVAEPTTLTGSIGIFGMFPDASGLLTEKLGVKFDEVKTNKNSGFGTMARPFSEEEMGYLSAYIDRGYKLFRQRVADGRRLSTDAVEKIAQGRVWLGQDALKIKLVDQLGGLDDAVAKAAKLAKVNDYYTAEYPAKASWMDDLLDNGFSSGSYIDEQMRMTMGEYYSTFMLLKNINRQSAIQARMPYVITIK